MNKTLLVTLFLSLFLSELSAQTPTIQDCLGARVLCGSFYQEDSPGQSEGNYENEIFDPPGNTCHTFEQSGIWYTFVPTTTGNFSFSLTPLDGCTDYDWIVFDMTGITCSDLASAGRFYSATISTNNYGAAGCSGPTGASTAMGGPDDCNGPGTMFGPPWNADIPVVAGTSYVLYVSNWEQSASGYQIDFSESTADLFDDVAPKLDTVISSVCEETDQVTWQMTENILCQFVSADYFSIRGPSGTIHTISDLSGPVCALGGAYDKTFTGTVSPPLTEGGIHELIMESTPFITDNCGNWDATNKDSIEFVRVVGEVEASAVANCNGLCNGSVSAVATSSVGGGFSYDWNILGGGASHDEIACTGEHIVTATDDSGCVYMDTIDVPLGPFVAADFEFEDSLCFEGHSFSFTNTGTGGGSTVHAWTFTSGTPATSSDANPSGITFPGPGVYNVELTTTQNACDDVVDFDVTVLENPTVTASGASETCSGDCDGSLSAVGAGGAGNYTYNWDNGIGAGADQSDICSGTYIVTVTDDNGCESTDSFDVEAGNNPVDYSVNTDTVVCNGGSDGSLTVDVTSGPPPYEYALDGGTPQMSNEFDGLSAGTYTLTIFDGDGCENVTDVNITEPAALGVSISPENSNISGGDCVTLTATIVPSQAGTYQWSPTTGLNDPTLESPLACPDEETTYSVTFVSDAGCEVSGGQSKVVIVPDEVNIPNAITPNGDLVNDWLQIPGLEQYDEYIVEIFTRSGVEVFSSADYDNTMAGSWNGTWEGNELPAGAYMYRVVLGDNENILTGAITIIRE